MNTVVGVEIYTIIAALHGDEMIAIDQTLTNIHSPLRSQLVDDL